MKKRAGFTLMEALIAVTIFSITALVLQGMLRAGFESWARGERLSEEHQKQRTFFNWMGRDLRNAVDLSPVVSFKGDAASLTLTCVAVSGGLDGQPLPLLQKIQYQYNKKTKILSRKAFSLPEQIDEEVVDWELSPVDFFEFKYAAQDEDAEERGRWISKCCDDSSLPAGVQVRLDDLETTFWVPLGGNTDTT